MTGSERGHRGLPHTADVRIEAWAPTRDACLSEAVAALVDTFADTTGARPDRTVTADLTAESDDDALAAVLDEVIYALDTEDVVPLGLRVEPGPPGVLRIHLPVTAAGNVEFTGAAPKAVALSGLSCTREHGRWTCTATIDV